MALDPQIADLLRRLADSPAPQSQGQLQADVATARAGSLAMWRMLAGPRRHDCTVRRLEIEGAAGPRAARLYRPHSTASPLPLTVFFHGGGWSMGDLDSYDDLMCALAALSGTSLLSVDYRLAPEHKYPAGLDDAEAAVRWAVRHADDLGADRRRLAVMGDSAGGNLAAVVAQRLRGDEEVALAAQFLLYPVLDVASSAATYPSRLSYGSGHYLLSQQSIETTVAWYLEADRSAAEPAISPLLAPDLHGLPPTVIVTAGHDPLLDEGRAYAERLRRADVPVRFTCFDSAIHAFLSFGVLDIAQEGRRHVAQEMRLLLAAAPGGGGR